MILLLCRSACAAKTEDTDSGFDSLKDDLKGSVKYENVEQKECLIQEDEMQDDRLTRLGSGGDYRTCRRDKYGQFARL